MTTETEKEYRAFLPENPDSIPFEDIDLLERCKRFDTLGGHAERICSNLGHSMEVASSIEEDLRDLVDTGMLVSRCALDDRWSPAKDTPTTPIKTMCIPTKDRPCELQRLASSLSDHCRNNDRRLSLLLMDDSQGDTCDHEAIRSQNDFEDVRVITRSSRAKMVEALKEHGIPSQVAAFLLLGPPTTVDTLGSNRNAALLATAGDRFFSMDDDIVARVAAWGPDPGHPRIDSTMDPTEIRLFSSMEDSIAPEHEPHADFLSSLESLPGRTLRSALCSLGKPSATSLSRASASAIRALEADKGFVRIATTGFMGDSGMSGFNYYLYLRGESRNRLMAAGHDFDSLLYSRLMKRCVPVPTLSDSPFFMAGCFAMDNTLVTPPFFSCQRNSDGMFGGALKAFFPDDLIANLPLMCAHIPPPKAPRGEGGNRSQVPPTRTSDVLLRAMAEATKEIPENTNPIDRMELVGEALLNFSALPSKEMRRTLDERRKEVLKARAAYLQKSTQLPIEGEGGRRWLAAVELYASQYEAELESNCLGIPHDLIEDGKIDKATELLQELLNLYGHALTVWPKLWEACAANKELRAVLFAD